MSEMKLYVPTYYGRAFRDEVDRGEKSDFGDPHIPVVIRPSEGVRIVLGSHDYFDGDAPDIQIERRPCGWAIFLHPLGGGDPSGYVYFLDDGRSYLVPERDLGTTPVVVPLNWNDSVDEVDHPAPAPCPKSETCELCSRQLEASGDNWDGLCPECADFVSAYLDRFGLTHEHRDAVVAHLKAGPR